MTVTVTSTFVRAAGNGVTTVVNFPFLVTSSGDLIVRDILDSTGTPTTLALNTHYTVQLSATGEGGTVTFLSALAAGHTYDIRSNVPATQGEDIRNQGRFLPEIHEGVFDKAVRLIQDLTRKVGQSIQAPDYEASPPNFTLPNAIQRALNYLAFDVNGNAVVTSGTGGGDASLRNDLANTTTAGKGNEMVSIRRTTAEISAGVTPVNYTYPEFWVTRYGGDPTGAGFSDTAFVSANAVAAVNGGRIIVPPTSLYFKIATAIQLSSGVSLEGYGYASRIHTTNTTRLGAIKATGTSGVHKTNVSVRNLRVTGVVVWTAGVPSVQNGAGIDAIYCDGFTVENCWVEKFQDDGIGSTDGQRPHLNFNRVDNAGQAVQVFAQNLDVYGAEMIGNTATNTGIFNAIHCEGLTAAGVGLVIAPRVIGNSSDGTQGLGVNIENAPKAVVVGNTSRNSGLVGAGSPTLLHGINLFGSPNSTVTGNNSFSNPGYGVLISAGCGATVVSGNTTLGNTLGSCQVSDGGGVSSTLNVAMGINSWGEGDIVFTANTSFLNRIQNLKFSNVAVTDAATLDWYEEGTFTPVVTGDGTAGAATYTQQDGRFTRIGNRVFFSIRVAWSAHTGTGNFAPISGLPYAASSAFQPACSVYRNALAATANNNVQSFVTTSASTVTLNQADITTGAASALPIDTVVTDLRISGHYTV